MRLRELFIEALQKATALEREAFLAAECGNDAELRRGVDQLLVEHERQGTFLLDKPPPGVGSWFTAGAAAPGMQIGAYTLREQVAEGGMGVVFRAEQSEPVARQVALKIIKPGMDTQQVLARFEAERQALALMDHPNIARVLDAGATASGHPYFVMEFVDGQPIAKYCDDKRLDIRQRLELMVPVCQAIQHAHQKGIIHRDIKPSNILVAEYDGRAVPKVIDFGVSKAFAQKLTEQSVFTLHGQIIGTLEYMSPEQAGLSQQDVDTRSDVYSLGVLLYELLIGTTPFDKHALQAAAFHEVLRMIREEEPVPPSTRLSRGHLKKRASQAAFSMRHDSTTVSDAQADSLPAPTSSLASIAAVRRTEPTRLAKTIRGELDWIVMKALEKDRSRRYETADSLAGDLRRYLDDEQVHAHPPSAAYRFRKFARRNRTVLTTGALLSALLLTGAAVSTWQALRATRAEALAKSNELRALAEEKKSLEIAEAERNQREIAEDQARKLEEQRQLLENNQRVTNLVVNEILDVVRTPADEAADRHAAILRALSKLNTIEVKDRTTAFLNVGTLLLGMSQLSSARAAFDAGLALDARDRRLYTQRAELHMRQGNLASAVADCTSAIENLEYPPAETAEQRRLPYARRAFAYCRQGKIEQSLADFESSFKISPLATVESFAWGFDGGNASTAGAVPDPRLGQGITNLIAQARDQSRRTPAGRFNRANALAQFGAYALAQEEFNGIVTASSVTSNDIYYAAVVAAANADRESYRRFCASMLKRNGKSLNVFTPWACVLAPEALDDYTPAIAVARAVVAKWPGPGSDDMALGSILYRAGQTKEAMKILQSVVGLPQFKHTLGLSSQYGPYMLAMAEQSQGNLSEARKWLDQGNRLTASVISQPGNWRRRVTLDLLKREATRLIAPEEGAAAVSPRCVSIADLAALLEPE